MHSERTRAHAVQLLNEKNRTLMPFKNKTVRAHAIVYVTADFVLDLWSEPTLVSWYRIIIILRVLDVLIFRS